MTRRIVPTLAFVAALGLGLAPVPGQEGVTGDAWARLTPGMLGRLAPEDGEEKGGGVLSSFLTGSEFGGYIDVGYTQNLSLDNAERAAVGGRQENPGRVFDRRHNEFTLHDVMVEFKKETGENAPVGYHATFLIGTDASVVTGASPTAGDIFAGDDLNFTAANIQLRAPDSLALLGGTVVKLGRFETLHGAEVIHSVRNANYSRSILFGYAIPFTHTGVLVEKGVLAGEGGKAPVHLKCGWVNGWDNMLDNNNSGSLMAGASLDPCEWFSTSVAGMWGPEQTTAAGAHANGDYRTLIDIVTDLKMPQVEGMDALSGLSMKLNLDWAGEEGVGGAGPGGPYAQWWGFAGILRWDFAIPGTAASESDNWYVAFRGEYFDDVDGTRLPATTTAAAGNDVWELTWTLGYKPVEVLLLRGEVRYDKAETAIFGGSNNQVTLAANAVLTF